MDVSALKTAAISAMLVIRLSTTGQPAMAGITDGLACPSANTPCRDRCRLTCNFYAGVMCNPICTLTPPALGALDKACVDQAIVPCMNACKNLCDALAVPTTPWLPPGGSTPLPAMHACIDHHTCSERDGCTCVGNFTCMLLFPFLPQLLVSVTHHLLSILAWIDNGATCTVMLLYVLLLLVQVVSAVSGHASQRCKKIILQHWK